MGRGVQEWWYGMRSWNKIWGTGGAAFRSLSELWCLTITSSGTLLHRPEFELHSWLPEDCQHMVMEVPGSRIWVREGSVLLSSVAQWSTCRCPPYPHLRPGGGQDISGDPIRAIAGL